MTSMMIWMTANMKRSIDDGDDAVLTSRKISSMTATKTTMTRYGGVSSSHVRRPQGRIKEG